MGWVSFQVFACGKTFINDRKSQVETPKNGKGPERGLKRPKSGGSCYTNKIPIFEADIFQKTEMSKFGRFGPLLGLYLIFENPKKAQKEPKTAEFGHCCFLNNIRPKNRHFICIT